MASDRILRIACGCSVAYNLAGAVSLAWPATFAAPWGMPVPNTRFYTTQLALVVLLFAGVYGWLATSAQPHRPVVAVCAVGKLQFFAVFVAYWAMGQLPARAVLSATGDLVLGLIFAWWLWSTRAGRG